MIDLTRVKSVMTEIELLIRELDGVELDETDAVASQSKGQARQLKAQKSQELNLLGQRLDLAAALVRNEYWFARGEVDPLNRDRQA